MPKTVRKIGPQSTKHSAPEPTLARGRVFIVHGHNEAAKEKVARFVERQGHQAVVLHELADRGQTIIQKLEAGTDSIDFVIALLTADDEGHPRGKPELRTLRARQNVIAELFLFIGRLGRSQICVLHEDGVEIPSDCAGLLYVPFDQNDGWMLRLSREMASAGLAIDLNRLVGA